MIPPIASRFVAGETAAEAIAHAREIADRGLGAIVNRLGEHYGDRAAADRDTDRYRRLLDDLEAVDGRACVSVKPSQLGLGVGAAVFEENLGRIVDRARDLDRFVWIDMEDSSTTDATLAAFDDLVHEHDGGVGVCLQANLKRTGDDLERFAGSPGKIRLVKGAYGEPKAIAHTDRGTINAAYRDHLRYMFEHYDGGIAVGSHDPAMIDLARTLHGEFGTPYEVQMLMGVRTDAQFELARDVDVWQYIPYGPNWFDYFTRRVLERKENALFALRAIVGR